jgi:hypothetical protein
MYLYFSTYCTNNQVPYVYVTEMLTIFQPLIECYMWLKETNVGVNLSMVENWFRTIQVEVERTHPEINMSSNGGYLLSGIYIR